MNIVGTKFVISLILVSYILMLKHSFSSPYPQIERHLLGAIFPLCTNFQPSLNVISSKLRLFLFAVSLNKPLNMAMHIPKPPGFAQMLKDGAKHYSGVDEAVLRNVDACKELATTTRSTYGPNGQNKMVINHLEKLFVTNDAATILRELEVQHPAAKMLVMASHQQEQECGDGTNFVLVFAGALLEQAEELLKMGLSTTEIQEGYQMACNKALELLPDMEVGRVKDLKDGSEVRKALKTAVMSKQYGNEDFISELIVDACISVMPSNQKSFNVDNIRVNKILGQGIYGSTVVQGMVFRRQVEGEVTGAVDAKVAVYSCPLDLMQTETKGTIKIQNAQELLDFSKGEESQVEEHVKAIADSGTPSSPLYDWLLVDF